MLESIYLRHHQQITFVMLNRLCQLSSFYLFLSYIYSTFYLSRYHFNNFLELYSTLNRKKVFVTNFPFLMDLLNSLAPHPSPTTQQPKSSKHGSFFVNAPLISFAAIELDYFCRLNLLQIVIPRGFQDSDGCCLHQINFILLKYYFHVTVLYSVSVQVQRLIIRFKLKVKNTFFKYILNFKKL